MHDDLPATVLQFGGGKFLRAFADLFVEHANRGRTPVGRVAVLQSSDSARAAAIAAADEYRVALRGLAEGQVVDRVEQVTCLARAIVAGRQWPDAVALARSADLRLVISNTTEAGFAVDQADALDAQPPCSFPAKLATLLWHRFQAGRPGVAILPCELLDNNARRLLNLVVELTAKWNLPNDFATWLRDECRWHNTLVDRIVSSPSVGDAALTGDPLAAVAEPFAFWGIDGDFRLPGLSDQPAVYRVADLAPYTLRKVRILNGAHTALVAKALPRGMITVKAAVADADVRTWLEELLFEEVVPALEGRVDAPSDFARTVLERFANPFLEHKLADIAMHHAVKCQTRIAPTIADFHARFGRAPRRLEEVLATPIT